MKTTILRSILPLLVLQIGCKDTGNFNELHSTQGEWKLVRNSQGGYFQGLWFADRDNGWAVGDSGRILHTSDAGTSWKVQVSGTVAPLKSVHFFDSSKGWIGASNNSIGITTNGGASWSWQQPTGEPRRTFMALSFVNHNLGWVVDNFGGILHTEDGGTTWTPQTSGTTWAITSVQFLDANEGWATATNRVVLHTTNGGNNWIALTLDNIDCGNGVAIFEDIFFSGRSKGWICTNVSASSIANPVASVVYTSDMGSTWVCRPTPESCGIFSIKFIDENVGWAASCRGILHTTDNGRTWTYQLQGSDDFFVDLWFVDQSHGWALTFTGNIYRYQTL